MQIFDLVVVFCINNALSAITAKPGMQRKSVGEGCNFQWSITGAITNYSVYNQTLGFQSQLKKETSHTLDNQSGVVTLIIWDIQLSDAGNYLISVTIGTVTQIDASALLFVYGQPQIVVNHTSDGIMQQPATEDNTVELTCTAISTSLPVVYRPKLYYQWYVTGIGTLQNVSSGPAKLVYSGKLISGYSIKDGGRTIVIASAQYLYTQGQGILCYGQEQWSPNQFSGNWYNLPLKYRPYITSRIPASKRFNAIIGDYVTLSFNFQAMPNETSTTNWTFLNTARSQELLLPAMSSYTNSSSSYSLAFTFPSEVYYGYYSIGLSNAIGSTTETFQVLRPGPPDTPSIVTATFVSSCQIAVAWNCMWFNGSRQQIFLQLKSLNNNRVIEILYPSVSTDCYNSSYVDLFQNGIQPESDYEVSVWSSNDFGSSDVIKLFVKTPKIFKLSFSPKTISLNGNQATIKFNATEGTIPVLFVECCDELLGNCDQKYYYNVDETVREVTCDNIPMGNVYVFGLYAYGDDGYRNQHTTFYYLGMVTDVRFSSLDATEPEVCIAESDGEETSPQPIVVIVLGVLLGVAVLALIVCLCLIAFLVFKRRQSTQLNNSQSVQPMTRTRAPLPSTQQRTNEAFEDDDAYESVERDSTNDTFYTALEGQRDT